MAHKRDVVLSGHGSDPAVARAALADADPEVRGVALGALARLGALTAADVEAALADPDPHVRRRAAEEVGRAGGAFGAVGLLGLLADPDPTVAEMTAWACGERSGDAAVVGALASMAGGHEDALCREAAVAALGALGDPEGLPAILAATTDRPPVRRRAVIALAPFEGPEVDAALHRALEDRDRQVRQAAEDLLSDD